VFVITQMHGLDFSSRARWAIGLTYMAGVLLIYNRRGWGRLEEVVRIPFIDYLAVLALAGLIALALRVGRGLSGRRRIHSDG
jgi:hypothetical protein